MPATTVAWMSIRASKTMSPEENVCQAALATRVAVLRELASRDELHVLAGYADTRIELALRTYDLGRVGRIREARTLEDTAVVRDDVEFGSSRLCIYRDAREKARQTRAVGFGIIGSGDGREFMRRGIIGPSGRFFDAGRHRQLHVLVNASSGANQGSTPLTVTVE